MIKKLKQLFVKAQNAASPKDGTKVINEVISGFQSHIEKLNQGIQLCDTEHSDNKELIESLNKTNMNLIATKTKANQLVDNLTKLIPS